MNRNEIRQLLQTATKDWPTYLHPNLKPGTFIFDPRCLDVVGNDMDAMQQIAVGLQAHLPRMTAIIAAGDDAALSEWLLTAPTRATWHLILFEGVMYCSASELLPYM
jgi:hypothetical protein